MAGRKLRRGEHVPHGLRQIQQAHRIGHGGAVFPHALGDVLLPHAEVLGQTGVGLGLFDGIETLTLEVLDERHLQHVLVGRLADDDGQQLEAELAGGSEAAFPGDEFQLVIHPADDQRLDDAVLADGLHELAELVGLELLARLQRTGNDLVRRHALHDVTRGRLGQRRNTRSARPSRGG